MKESIKAVIGAAAFFGVIIGGGALEATLDPIEAPTISEATIEEPEHDPEAQREWMAAMEQTAEIAAVESIRSELAAPTRSEEEETISTTEESTTEETESETEQETIEASWMANDYTSPEPSEVDEQDRYILQKIAWAEAGAQGPEAMAHIMRVILNRKASEDFPATVYEVVFEPEQFAPITNGAYYAAEPNAATAEALAMIEAGWDETLGATYFCAEGHQGWHQQALTYMYTFDGIMFWTYLK